jgi:hypothetical protein
LLVIKSIKYVSDKKFALEKRTAYLSPLGELARANLAGVKFFQTKLKSFWR